MRLLRSGFGNPDRAGADEKYKGWCAVHTLQECGCCGPDLAIQTGRGKMPLLRVDWLRRLCDYLVGWEVASAIVMDSDLGVAGVRR